MCLACIDLYFVKKDERLQKILFKRRTYEGERKGLTRRQEPAHVPEERDDRGRGSGAAACRWGTVTGSDSEDRAPITKGDIAILTFLSALEQVEADLWIQYAESRRSHQSGALRDRPVAERQENQHGTCARGMSRRCKSWMATWPQYIADNTDDEISHHRFLNYPLQSKGASPIDLSHFAILPPSKVTGVPPNGAAHEPQAVDDRYDLVDALSQRQCQPGSRRLIRERGPRSGLKGPHRAIPLDDTDAALNADKTIPDPLQAIASTAGFHFAFIEQAGTSLYPQLAQRVTNVEVLRVLLSIGPSEAMHFQTWHDKAGNAPMLTDTDPSRTPTLTTEPTRTPVIQP